MINRDATAERRAAAWAQLLTALNTHDLPVPISIDAENDTVWLPANERGQVDAWAAALGLGPARVNSLEPRPDGSPSGSAHYAAHSPDYASRSAMCHITLGDAGEHWSPPVLLPLAAALTSTVAHLTATAMLTPDSPDLPVATSTVVAGVVEAERTDLPAEPVQTECYTCMGNDGACGTCKGRGTVAAIHPLAPGNHGDHSTCDPALCAERAARDEVGPEVTAALLDPSPLNIARALIAYGADEKAAQVAAEHAVPVAVSPERAAQTGSEDISDDDLDQVCTDLSDTKRYMQRLVAQDCAGFVAVLGDDDHGNPTEMVFGIDRRIYFAGGFWSVKS